MGGMGDSASLHRREEVFHDDWAASTPAGEILVDESFEGPCALEHRIILRRWGGPGALRGARLLDVGCGLGEASVYFAKLGAEVVASDLSPGMVAKAEELAAHHGVGDRVRGHVAAAEELWPWEGEFDYAYAGNVVHHVGDRDGFWTNLRTALVPGGRFATWDPVKYNPAINVYRRMATEVRTEDERPLGIGDLRDARRFFPGAVADFTWIARLGLFLSYRMRGMDPNRVRYWKRIHQETAATLPWFWGAASLADRALCEMPWVRWLAWNITITGARP